MRSFEDFRESLDHEFKDVEPIVGLYGIRLDKNDGIKATFGLQDLKSADYFTNLKRSDVILEFSDIGRQIDKTITDIAEVKQSDMSKQLKRKLSGDLRKELGQEARDKYKDTCLLFSTLRDQFQDKVTGVPELSDGCKFIVVYAPFRADLSNSKIDIVRFIEVMKDNLVTMIPDELCNKVEVLTLDIFKRRYE